MCAWPPPLPSFLKYCTENIFFFVVFINFILTWNKIVEYCSVLDDLIESMLTRNSNQSYNCGSCSYTSIRKSHVKAHIEAKHIQTTGFSCLLCGKLCNTRNALMIHKTRFHKLWRNKINFISDMFKELDRLIQGKMVRTSDGQFSCCECSFTSRSKYCLANHVESKHVNYGGVICHLCEKVLPTRQALRMHNSREHRNLLI